MIAAHVLAGLHDDGDADAAVADAAVADAAVADAAVADVAVAEAADLRRALEALHEASFAWAMCCCRFARNEAEDALQLAYMKVLEGRAQFAGRSSFRTWLFGVIRLTAREVHRRELARRVLTGRIFVDALTAPPADELGEQERERAEVRRALRSLSARQRDVLELVIHQGLTLDAAADVLGISPGTARTHYERGKQALRAALRRR